ncbi:SusD-like starch-binding protein associating with outer membrane [Pseudobacter ginsenosidimutans]|uniref:SusD-like starch-binding protein associating with outer membrane n=2 Tax=Pseudobacter ginsenosidimutans TaxID=661488 RepID=A0A4Q7N304_9BACT|nr:RagB/SusD family nutrient uptake outer membrane protein [Pseudobacter ginsenosidimutans]RZS75479.1 SusD-like starch-binding protein associating with outer membrane [Pseudobacter ginsenosidimutans]
MVSAMNTKSKLIILMIILGSAASCKKFLEPQSQQYFVPKDASAINSMLLGNGYPRNQLDCGEITAGLQVLDDDIALTTGTAAFVSDANFYNALFHTFTWQAEMHTQMRDNGGYGKYKNLWDLTYKLILGTNAALDYVDIVEGTKLEKNKIKAQAYALRGFYFFHLVNLFGEPYNHNPQAPGVPLKLSSKIENEEIPRNTVKEVYDQVVKDLKEAESYYLQLPESSQFAPDFRTSLPMVQLLLSRVYLYMENWKEAASYAQQVIRDNRFSLLDLNTLQLAPVGGRRLYHPFTSFKSPEVIWLYGLNGQDITPWVFTNTYLTAAFKTERYFLAAPELVNSFETGDLRKEWYISRDQDNDNVFLAYGKGVPYLTNSNLLLAEVFSRAFRLSEAYLNLAEAGAKSAEVGVNVATDALNALRIKRFKPENYVPVSGVTGDALVQMVREERRMELCYEAHRWFDLRRYGMPGITHTWRVGLNAANPLNTYTLKEKDPAYTLPIPEEVMNRNRALEQNKLAPKRDN